MFPLKIDSKIMRKSRKNLEHANEKKNTDYYANDN